MTEIIPAILPKSYDELEYKLDIISGHVPVVQIDICDGAYVPNRTWPYLKGVDADGRAQDQIFEEIVDQNKALPHWEDLDYEFDLMTRGTHEKIPDFIAAGATRLVVHKAAMTEDEFENVVHDYGKHSEELGPFDIELGVAIKPTDSPESIADFVNKIHFVQVMGIDKEGFQGQSLDTKSIQLVKSLKKSYPKLPVSVDGSVNEETAKLFIEAGADRLIVGSALFESIDFLGTLERFRSL